MNQLQIFENPEFGAVRTVEIDGEVWLVGKDIADDLGYQNGSRDINRHVDEEDRKKMMIFDGNQNKEAIVINESGLYALVLSSKLPTARKFRHWVTSEVLPSIRKTGSYTQPNLSNLSPQLQLLINMEMEQKRQAEQLATVEQKVDGIRDLVGINPNGWREDCRKQIARIAQTLGGTTYIRDVNTEVYNLVDARAGVSLETRLTNKRRRMADEGVCKSKRDKLSKVDVIADDKKLIEIYIKVVRELAVKYGVM